MVEKHWFRPKVLNRGVRREGLGGPRRSKNLVKNPFKLLLKEYRDPPKVL